MKKYLLSLLLGLAITTPVSAQDLALRIEYESFALGSDGVTRITRFSERLIRRDRQSWVARIVPPGAHEEAEHQTGDKSHKHMDLAASARWITLANDNKLQVRLVNGHDRVIVNVPPTDYANIGFDGKWTSASTLLDPEQIGKMKPAARPAAAGTRWYEGGTAELKVFILWDETARYPRRIESTNASGTRRNLMVAHRESMPSTLPWAGLKGFAEKEFSDLLD